MACRRIQEESEVSKPRDPRTSVIHPTRRERGLERLWDGCGGLLELGTLGDVFDGSVGDREELRGGSSAVRTGPDLIVERGLFPRVGFSVGVRLVES
jgi:hypothetical protein